MRPKYIISKSTAQDINQLLLLINSAYRGEEAKKGWTHEADLIEGSIRTDEAMLLELLNTIGACFCGAFYHFNIRI